MCFWALKQQRRAELRPGLRLRLELGAGDLADGEAGEGLGGFGPEEPEIS